MKKNVLPSTCFTMGLLILSLPVLSGCPQTTPATAQATQQMSTVTTTKQANTAASAILTPAPIRTPPVNRG